MDMRGDGGYGARCVFPPLKSLGVTPPVRVRADSNTRAKGKDRTRTGPAGRAAAPAGSRAA